MQEEKRARGDKRAALSFGINGIEAMSPVR